MIEDARLEIHIQEFCLGFTETGLVTGSFWDKGSEYVFTNSERNNYHQIEGYCATYNKTVWLRMNRTLIEEVKLTQHNQNYGAFPIIAFRTLAKTNG